MVEEVLNTVDDTGLRGRSYTVSQRQSVVRQPPALEPGGWKQTGKGHSFRIANALSLFHLALESIMSGVYVGFFYLRPDTRRSAYSPTACLTVYLIVGLKSGCSTSNRSEIVIFRPDTC